MRLLNRITSRTNGLRGRKPTGSVDSNAEGKDNNACFAPRPSVKPVPGPSHVHDAAAIAETNAAHWPLQRECILVM